MNTLLMINLVAAPEELKALAVKAAWLVGLIVADVILGVIVAIKAGEFRMDKLPDFLADYGLKIVGWLVLEGIKFLPPGFQILAGLDSTLADGAYALLAVAAGASVIGHVMSFGAIPNGLRQLSSKVGIPPTRLPAEKIDE